MANDFIYPDITAKGCKDIELVRRYLAEHPNYLDDAPYENLVIQYLRDWFKAQSKEEERQIDNETLQQTRDLVANLSNEDQVNALHLEVVQLYAELKAAKPTGVDINSELMAYFKTSSALIEKLLAFQERSLGLKQVQEFHSEVMNVMETILTPEQRALVLEKMRNALKL